MYTVHSARTQGVLYLVLFFYGCGLIGLQCTKGLSPIKESLSARPWLSFCAHDTVGTKFLGYGLWLFFALQALGPRGP